MKVPFVDLLRQYHVIKDEIDHAITDVLESGYFVLGRNVENFEKEFSQFCGVKYAIGVASGTDALIVSLKALEVKEGDEIITVPNTFVSTANAIIFVGAKPVFIDIDPQTYTMDPEGLKKAISDRTKAIVPVHLFGCPVDMDPILEIAEKQGIYVVEDACQAHGARYKGRRIGSIGNVTCFSFYPAKNLGAYGDGGLITTNEEEIAEKTRMLRNYGETEKYYCDAIGYNSRLDEIQAAILRVKLRYLNKFNEARRSHAKLYNELLSNGPIITPVEREFLRHVYHLYVIRCRNRGRLRQFLSVNGISTGIHYPIPIHMQKAYSHIVLSENSFPTAERYATEILSLPMFPELTNEEIEYVCKFVNSFYGKTTHNYDPAAV